MQMLHLGTINSGGNCAGAYRASLIKHVGAPTMYVEVNIFAKLSHLVGTSQKLTFCWKTKLLFLFGFVVEVLKLWSQSKM